MLIDLHLSSPVLHLLDTSYLISRCLRVLFHNGARTSIFDIMSRQCYHSSSSQQKGRGVQRLYSLLLCTCVREDYLRL